MRRFMQTFLSLLVAAVLVVWSLLPASAQQLVIQEPGDHTLRPTECASIDIQLVHVNGHLIPERQHSYTSSNTAIATVSERGLVCAVAPGTATVTLSARSRVVQIVLTVTDFANPPPDTVVIPPDTVVIPPDTVIVPDTIFVPPDTITDPDPGALGSIAITWGDAQEGAPGVQLPLVSEVRVVDLAGAGVGGVTVEWIPQSGTIGAAQTVTGSAGGTRTFWTLGSDLGEQTLLARAVGYGQVTFTATAVAPQPPPPPPPPPDTLNPPPPPPPPGALWRHMRTSVIDYRIHHRPAAERPAEYDFAASKYDHVTGGIGLLAAYRQRNPSVSHGTYDKFWFTPSLDAGGTESWIRTQGCSVEDIYLHQAGAAKDSASRITAQQFAGRWYWYYNLGDACFQRWRAQRTDGLVRSGTNTIFYDSNSPSTVRKYVPAVTAEYPSYSAYFADYNGLLVAERRRVPAGYLLPNHAQNFSKAEELTVARLSTGGVMTEYENTPYGSGVKEWNAIDQLVAAGAVVQFSTGVSPGSKNDSRYGSNAGNYNSIAERVLMWEYASYLMVVDPARMDAVLFETYGLNWSLPFSATWLDAFERDIGLATGKRAILMSGTDPAGQSYQVWSREFANALVLIRPQGGKTAAGSYNYGDSSAVSVALPSALQFLRADGSLASAVSSIELRAGEAVVMVR